MTVSPDWEKGFESGQSDIMADWEFALYDLLPDHVEAKPTQVANFIRSLQPKPARIRVFSLDTVVDGEVIIRHRLDTTKVIVSLYEPFKPWNQIPAFPMEILDNERVRITVDRGKYRCIVAAQ